MIDTRCYNCSEPFVNIERDNIPKFSIKEYKGKGIFVCPECGDILDVSKNTYNIIITRKYDEDGELYTEILEFDTKLQGDGKDVFETDIIEMDIFDNIPFGKYKLEIMWYYYECGGFESGEWDVKIEILSEEEIK